jgi:hypothetical protein
MIDQAYVQERIDKTKTAIAAYEDAIIALAGGAQQYSLNTGQTIQVVTRANLTNLRETLDMLENRLSYWCNKQSGAQVFNGRPGVGF